MDLSVLQALEMESVLEVLHRDRLLRTVEEERIRRLKYELMEIRRKGAKSFSRQYSERTCARCQRPLGKLWNSGAVCQGCSHRICSKCRVGASTVDWKCTVCHAYREVKIRSGQWFLDERAKKFPPGTERHETAGDKLLKSIRKPSQKISVVPPTPPFDCTTFGRSGDLKNSKPFTKSMEDLMVSFTSHMKKVSKSQNDVRGDLDLLTVNGTWTESNRTGRKSSSDSDINKSSNLIKVPSLPNLFRRNKDSDQSGSSGVEDEVEVYSGEKRGSTSSIGSECALYPESHRLTGDLELLLVYNSNSSCLEMTVGGCRNLAHGDVKRRKCHPYVKIYLLPDKAQSGKLKTSVKRNTTEPVYNETLQYHIERPLLYERTLQASVWHSGTLKRKVFLGQVLISLEHWRFQETASQCPVWYPLCPKPECPEDGAVEHITGEMQLRIKFSFLRGTSSVCRSHGVDTGPRDNGQLAVLIKGAKHLPFKANTRLGIYVKGCLTLPGGRELVQKTPTLKGKPGSNWSQQLVFDSVCGSELLDCSLALDLWDHASSSSGLSDHQRLGGALLATGSPWQPVLHLPNKWHDFSLPIHANVNTGLP